MDESKLLKSDLQKLIASQRQQISVLKNTILGLERQIEDLNTHIDEKQIKITSLTNANMVNNERIENARTEAREALAKEYDAFVNKVKTQTDNLLIEHAHVKEGLIKYDAVVQILRNKTTRQANEIVADTNLLMELVETIRSIYVTDAAPEANEENIPKEVVIDE